MSNGVFTVTPDLLGGVLSGGPVYLQIGVRTNGAAAFMNLSPLELLTPTPYAVYAEGANAAGLTGALPSADLSGTYGGALSLTNVNNSVSGVFIGNGAGLTSLNPTNISARGRRRSISAATRLQPHYATTAANVTGNISDAQLSANIARLNGTNVFTGTNSFSGVTLATNVNNVLAGTFTGNGAALTSLTPANISAGTAAINISGNAATATTAANFTGNISDAQLSANIARLNGTNAFTGTNSFSGVTLASNVNNVLAGTFPCTGNGAGLTSPNSARISACGNRCNKHSARNAATATTASTAATVTGNISDAQLFGEHRAIERGQSRLAASIHFPSGTTIATNGNNVLSGSFSGNGAGLTNLSQGTLPAGVLTNNYTGAITLTNITNAITGQFSGIFSGASFIGGNFIGAYVGSGSGLTSLNASELTSGAVGGARLAGVYANAVTVSNVNDIFVGSFYGNGGNITNLNGVDLNPGSVPVNRLASDSVTVNAGPGLSGGGAAVLGGSLTLTNSGVLSVTGNGDISATTAAGAVTLGSTATNINTAGAIVKRDGSGSFAAGSVTLSGSAESPASPPHQASVTSWRSGFCAAAGRMRRTIFYAGLNAGIIATTASSNTALGNLALGGNSNGVGNTAAGFGALAGVTSGGGNIGVESLSAGMTITVSNSNIDIGNNGLPGDDKP